MQGGVASNPEATPTECNKGGVAEWLKATVLKTVVRESGP